MAKTPKDDLKTALAAGVKRMRAAGPKEQEPETLKEKLAARLDRGRLTVAHGLAPSNLGSVVATLLHERESISKAELLDHFQAIADGVKPAGVSAGEARAVIDLLRTGILPPRLRAANPRG